jgi:hypothetical protein
MDTNARKRGLIWGGLLILLGGLLLVEQYTAVELSAWIWVGALALVGLIAFVFYITDRSDVWLLLTAYILWAVAGLVALITLDALPDDLVPLYVLTAIALPFVVVYLRDRTQWWALIPAYVLIVIGLMVALIELGILTDLLIPGYIMFAIAIPFLAVFARDTNNWWALIPGGVLAFIGIVFFVAEAALQFILPAFLILIGLWILVRGLFRKDRGDWEESKGVAPGDDVTPE